MAKKHIDHVAPDSDETREMEAEYNQATKSIEIQEIEASQESIRDVIWWKKRLDWTGWGMYAIGGLMWIIQDNERGLIIILIAFLLLMGNAFINTYRLRKRRIHCQSLLNAFKRKNTLPLYHDLLEKFSDMPHMHIHLADDGTIIITDRSKKEKN